MEANSYFFLGLAAEAVARIDRRKSRLMLASSFLVGTRFNSSRFSFEFILIHLKSDFYVWLLKLASEIPQVLQCFVPEDVLWTSLHRKPVITTVRTTGLDHVVLVDRNVKPSAAGRTFKFKPIHILNLDERSLFCGHSASEVAL